MLSFSDFASTGDYARDFADALAFCRDTGADGLLLDVPDGTLTVSSACAAEKFFSISNHGEPGLKRACFLLDGMKNFVLDGGGHTVEIDGIMIAAACDGCEHITLRNFTFRTPHSLNGQAEVVEAGDNWATIRFNAGSPAYIRGGILWFGDPRGEHREAVFFDECDKDTGTLRAGVTDYWVGHEGLTFTDYGNGLVRMTGMWRPVMAGNTLVFAGATRSSCGILLNGCRDVTIENVTFESGIGMGVIAQNCDTVTVSHMATRLTGSRRYSISADATHFVHCKGQITIRDCLFEGQLDDALNIHSIYLKIFEKHGNTLLVRFMHPEARGIDILFPGCTVRTVDPLSQLPNGEYTVASVRSRNLDTLEVTLDGDASAVKVGDLLDEVSWVPDLLFERNIVRRNRARGMLLASAGTLIIRNNLFESPGPAILFESDGQYWFESGGTQDVRIEDNTFENCGFDPWGSAVVEVIPRKAREEGRFYHGRIAVTGNTFRACRIQPASISDTREFVFENNTVEDGPVSAAPERN